MEGQDSFIWECKSNSKLAPTMTLVGLVATADQRTDRPIELPSLSSQLIAPHPPTYPPISPAGWVAFKPKIAESIENAFHDRLECRFEARHKIKGVFKTDTFSDWEEYIVDWETFEQVNVRTQKRRKIRRVKLRRGSEVDLEMEENAPEIIPFKDGDDVVIVKEDSHIKGATARVVNAKWKPRMAKVQVTGDVGPEKGVMKCYLHSDLRPLADTNI